MTIVTPNAAQTSVARKSAFRETIAHVRYVATDNPVTGLAFALFALLLLTAVVGAALVPYDPLASDTAAALQGPTARHWFGTDQLGRDIFSRVVVATRLDMVIAIASVALVFLAGGLAGVAAGFYGGWTDRIVGRIADTIMAFPLFVLAMGIVAALGNTVTNIVNRHRDHQLPALCPRRARAGRRAAQCRLCARGAADRQFGLAHRTHDDSCLTSRRSWSCRCR